MSLRKILAEASKRSDLRPWYHMGLDTQLELARLAGMDIEQWRNAHDDRRRSLLCDRCGR